MELKACGTQPLIDDSHWKSLRPSAKLSTSLYCPSLHRATLLEFQVGCDSQCGFHFKRKHRKFKGCTRRLCLGCCFHPNHSKSKPSWSKPGDPRNSIQTDKKLSFQAYVRPSAHVKTPWPCIRLLTSTYISDSSKQCLLLLHASTKQQLVQLGAPNPLTLESPAISLEQERFQWSQEAVCNPSHLHPILIQYCFLPATESETTM